jgi:hypothetical protein
MKEFIDKLIERLEEEKKYCSYNPQIRDEAINKSISIVNQLAEEYKGGWIPCSERLPETDDYVLCWYEYRIMQGTCEGEMKQTYGIGYYLKPFKNWGGEVSYGRDCKVIAWMPLSAPYTEGE